MNPLTLVPRLPLLPLEGLLKLAELIAEEAEREQHDPARVRRELEDAQLRRDAGEISEDELARIEDRLTSALVAGSAPAPHDQGADERS